MEFCVPFKDISEKKVQIGAETQVMKCQVQTFFVGESSPDMPYNIQLKSSHDAKSQPSDRSLKECHDKLLCGVFGGRL